MHEQDPTPSQLTIEERMRNASPDDVHGAFTHHSDQLASERIQMGEELHAEKERLGFSDLGLDDFDAQDAIYETIDKTPLGKRYAENAQASQDAEAAYKLYEEWRALPEEGRDNYHTFVQGKIRTFDGDPADDDAAQLRSAGNWLRDHYQSSLRSYFEGNIANLEPVVTEEHRQASRALTTEEMRERMERLNVTGGASRAQEAKVDEARRAIDDAHSQESHTPSDETIDDNEKRLRDVAERLKEAALPLSVSSLWRSEDRELAKRYHTDPEAKRIYEERNKQTKASTFSSTDPEEFLRVLELVGYPSAEVELKRQVVEEELRKDDSLTAPIFNFRVALKENGDLDDTIFMLTQKTTRS